MKQYHETKIGRIIEEEFDSRLENALFQYIMQTGLDNFMKMSEEDIAKVKSGNKIISDEVCQGMVRAAVRISKECNYAELTEYIRCYLKCTPQVKEVILYEEDFIKCEWNVIKKTFDLDEEDTWKTISLLAIITE